MIKGQDSNNKKVTKQARNTWLFVGLLLLAGFLHRHDLDPIRNHFLQSVIYCAEYLIYAGLILSWMQSVNGRLSSTWAKRYLLAAGSLMLLFLAAQFTKYRIAVAPGVARYCWYIYYIPILMIPTLFLMTCFRFYRGGIERKRSGELWFLLPAGMLMLGVLTNDLHMMAFHPNEGILHDHPFLPNEGIAGLIGSPNTYTHGFLYYTAYAWAGFALLSGVIFLLAAGRKSGRWKKALLPLLVLALMPVLFTLCNRITKDTLPIEFEFTEICIFSMLCVFEACIRSRLIPFNENYPGFFAQTELPVLITDKELNVAYQTRAAICATREQMKASLIAPVYPEPDIRLLGMEIRAGYAFRTEDESTVNRMNEELRDAGEVIRQENEILLREQELAAEQAGIEERSRLYRKAAQEVYPVQKKISEILEKAQPGTETFRSDIEKALVLTAFVKRKANFVLVEAERKTVTAKELASAIEESAHYLSYCGMNATTNVTAQRAFPCREAMAIYDCFEETAEKLLGITKEFFVRLQDDELLMMADAGELPANEKLPELTGLSLPVRQSFVDGQLILRAVLGGGMV